MIGIDITHNDKFKINTNESFLKKWFTQEELDYCISKPNPAQHLSGTFAAKEAIIKATNGKCLMQHIEIHREKSGKPTATITNTNLDIEISIAHDGDYAIAIAHIKNI